MDSGAAEKKVVRVTIFQQPYTLRAAGSPGETEALAAAVDRLMTQIGDRTGGDASRVAVLAALHLADRVRQLEGEIESLHKKTKDWDQRLSSLLAEDPPSD
jgi:cell division protein ZapA (FtsZ GTPase activity inhibitor)